MHISSINLGNKFFQTYLKDKTGLTIVEIGSLDVNGSLKEFVKKDNKYIGVDFAKGNNVDIVIKNPYKLPFKNNSIDVCLSSSCFEHSEFFWLLFNEIQRILKPNGIFYLNAPSNGPFHRYPVDCYRFYPDSGIALQNWARRNKYKTLMLESFVANKHWGVWNDFVAIFIKDKKFAKNYPERIQSNFKKYNNGIAFGTERFSNFSFLNQDQKINITQLILLSLSIPTIIWSNLNISVKNKIRKTFKKNKKMDQRIIFRKS
jgi:SAM-dependent methyltransferase